MSNLGFRLKDHYVRDDTFDSIRNIQWMQKSTKSVIKCIKRSDLKYAKLELRYWSFLRGSLVAEQIIDNNYVSRSVNFGNAVFFRDFRVVEV
jgi:hypothetical protein